MRSDAYGLKQSSGVDYSLVQNRQIDDRRFERQRNIRAASSVPPAEQQPKNAGPIAIAPQSATMDAFMRMVTGKEERTIADRISDPNRPTWEEYKKENADKLDLSGDGKKEMEKYRKKLDATREKRLAGSCKKKKKKRKKRSRLSLSDDSSSEDEYQSSKHKTRKKRKSHKRRRKSSDSDDNYSNSDDERSRRHKHSKKSKKTSRRNDRDTSSSPVRLSSFLQQSSHGSDDESS